MKMPTAAVGVVLSLVLGVGCSNRSDTTTGGAPAPGAQPGGSAAGGAPAQAGARGGSTAAGAAVSPEQYGALMKDVAQTVGAVQKNVKGNMLKEAATDAQRLATLFGDVERFWMRYNKSDAVKIAQTARSLATDVAGAAAAGDQSKATMAAGSIPGTCQECHTLYREGDAKSGFRFREGALTE